MGLLLKSDQAGAVKKSRVMDGLFCPVRRLPAYRDARLWQAVHKNVSDLCAAMRELCVNNELF